MVNYIILSEKLRGVLKELESITSGLETIAIEYGSEGSKDV